MAGARTFLRLAANAARGDLSQVGVLGTHDVWQSDLTGANTNGNFLYNPRTQYGGGNQSNNSFFAGWQGSNAAISQPQLAMGASALSGLSSRQQQQQSQQQYQQSRDPSLLWSFLQGQQQSTQSLHGLHDYAGSRPATFPQMFQTPAGPGLGIDQGNFKDPAATSALLASLLEGSMAVKDQLCDLAGNSRQGGYLRGRNSANVSSNNSGNIQRTRGSNSSIALNKEIMASTSVEQLLAIVRAHGHNFDFFNISSAVSRIPKLIDCSATGSQNPHALDAAALEAEAAITAAAAASRDAANMASDTVTNKDKDSSALAGSNTAGHLSPAAKELADRLCSLVLQHLQGFDGRGLANTAWAFAKLRYVPDASLPAQICKAAINKIHQFAPQNVSNLAWALVYMHYQDPHLLELLKDKARAQVLDMKPQELANIMWALASHEALDVSTSRVLGERAASMACVFKEQELSNIVWAMGRAGQYDPHLLQPLLSAARNKLSSFMPQGVSNMVWALGQLGHKDEGLLAAVARHCPSHLHHYDSQALSNLATGLASLNYEGHGLMRAVADEAAARGGRMAGQHMVAVLAACAALGIQHDKLLASVVDLVQNRPGCLEPPALASLAWALTKTDTSFVPAGVWDQVAAAVVAKMDRFTGQALVAVSMAFADQQHQAQGACGIKVLQAVASRLPVVVHALTPSQCMAISWAMMQAGANNTETTSCLIQQAATSSVSSSAAPLAQQQQLLRASQLCESLSDMASSGTAVDPRLHASLLATAKATAPDMDAHQLASSCHALATLGVLDVEALAMYEAALEETLTNPDHAGNSLVGPDQIKQMIQARTTVASMVAQRVGIPLTSLPANVLPSMPTTLAAAAQLTALNEQQQQQSDLFGNLRSHASNNPWGLNDNLAQDNQDFNSSWGADISALAVLAATQAVSQQQQFGSAFDNQQLLNMTASGAQLQFGQDVAKSGSKPGSPGNVSKAVWTVGGLGNGLLEGLTNSADSTHAVASHTQSVGSPTGSHKSQSKTASRHTASPSSSGGSSGANTARDGISALTADSTSQLDWSMPIPALISTDDVLGLANTSASAGGAAGSRRASSGSAAFEAAAAGLLGRRDSLEEYGSLWLPKDLLHQHAASQLN